MDEGVCVEGPAELGRAGFGVGGCGAEAGTGAVGAEDVDGTPCSGGALELGWELPGWAPQVLLTMWRLRLDATLKRRRQLGHSWAVVDGETHER